MERRTWFVCPHIGVRFVRLGLPSGMSGWVAAAGLVVGLVTPHSAVAQASPDLESGSRAEWAVEKLIGFGLIDDG
ncbi:MAG TPA: hypothetical protein VMO47_17405, partial [Rhodothermales bacterium]|nr:hypothetical protein [Rhodothermales bacterium]